MPEGLRDGAALLLLYPHHDPGGAAAAHVLLTVRGAGYVFARQTDEAP